MARTPLPELSDDALELLTWLPKEPIAVPKCDLAHDAFGHTDSVAIGRVTVALDEIKQLLGLWTRPNPDPYPERGQANLYGVRRVVWRRAQHLAHKYLDSQAG